MEANPIDPIFHTPLCELLGCDYPVLQAGMGGVARSALAGAVSEAGGFGSLGMVRESPELVTAEVERVRQITKRPFSVNLIPAATESRLFKDELAACADAGVEVVTYFWTLDEEAIAKAKSYGMTVLQQTGSLADSRAAVAAGADALIIQGVEAGGHVHGDVSSLVLLPQVCDDVDVPVAGSGGFATGRSLVAAMALGASGIHCGTAFLATAESFAHDVHKQRLVTTPSDRTVRTDSFAINWPKGSKVRVVATQMTDGLGDQLVGYDPDEFERVQIAEEDGRPIYRWSTDSPLKNMTGALDELALYAGQAVGQIESIETASNRLAAIMAEAVEVRNRLVSG